MLRHRRLRRQVHALRYRRRYFLRRGRRQRSSHGWLRRLAHRRWLTRRINFWRERDSANLSRLWRRGRLLRLGSNRWSNHWRRWRCGLWNRLIRRPWRNSSSRLLSRNLHRRLRSRNTFSGSLLQVGQLPAQSGNSIIEFGGFPPSAAVGNCGKDDGRQTHQHPAEQDSKDPFHVLALLSLGVLGLHCRTVFWGSLAKVC